MNIPQYVTSPAASSTYVVGSSNVDGGTLTLAARKGVDLRFGLFGYPQQSGLTEEMLETLAIESNFDFHSAIVRRLAHVSPLLIDADDLGL